ncbi:MAG: M3 family metallopeptidase, partial [Bdellovibrionales bacterium]|nr:M3 family metallopeptidase [Bdellovibrionales bacterium]
DFKRHGTNLSKKKKSRLIEIATRLTELSSKFKVNILEGTKEFYFKTDDITDLAGLPAIHLEAAKENAKQAGHPGSWVLTLEAPSYGPAMTYLKDASLRKKLYRARQEIAATNERNNSAIAEEKLKLRQEKAKLLSYNNFADFKTDTRMAASAKNALEFEQNLVEKVAPIFKKESDVLRDFKRKLTKDKNTELFPWDIAFYEEKLRKQKFDFDKELLRPYFQFENVLDGAFLFAEKLFGLRFEETKEMPSWHTDVKTFKIYDTINDTISFCYIDLFPRPGEKRSGAWQLCLIPRILGRDNASHYVGVFTGNFTKPTPDTPALLSFDEVTTLFHEFGHLLHHLFLKVDLDFFRSVPWDFIELPSQLLENWCWEKEMLDLFAKNYKTGEMIPKELLEKMLEAKNFRSASFLMRQLGFGVIDLKLHTEYDSKEEPDINKYGRDIENYFSPADLPEYHSPIVNFSHIFAGGYAAGYYSYMWASVLEAEAFSKFEKDGLFNKKVAKKLVEDIFEPGWTKDPLEMFNSFMGNKPDNAPDPSALLVREGILPAE